VIPIPSARGRTQEVTLPQDHDILKQLKQTISRFWPGYNLLQHIDDNDGSTIIEASKRVFYRGTVFSSYLWDQNLARGTPKQSAGRFVSALTSNDRSERGEERIYEVQVFLNVTISLNDSTSNHWMAVCSLLPREQQHRSIMTINKARISEAPLVVIPVCNFLEQVAIADLTLATSCVIHLGNVYL